MKENTFTFSALDASRYSDNWSHNVVTQVNCHVVASSTWELQMNLRYNDLVALLKRHFGIEDESTDNGSRIQQYRNISSTLHGFLTSVGKTPESRVGTELTSAFAESCERYLASLNVSPRTKSDRRTHLRLIKRQYDERPTPRQAKQSSNLSNALRMHIAAAGIPPKTLARRIGVSTSAIQRWIAGAKPNARGIPTLRRLEHALGLERDSLVKLLDEKECQPKAIDEDESSPSIGDTTNRRTTEPPIRRTPLSELFVQEWRALLDPRRPPKIPQ